MCVCCESGREGGRVTAVLVWGWVRCGCGECVLSSTGDVLVRGVGGVCDMCMCLTRGGVGGEGGEWMRELGLGFTNPLGTGGVLDMCLCFGCGGVGGVGGEWVGGLDNGRERWGGVRSV